MRIMAAIVLTLSVLTLTTVAAIGGSSPGAAAVDPSASPVPSPSASPTPTPASPALIRSAHHARRLAVRARGRLSFADRCMAHRQPQAVKRAPAASCGQLEWIAARAAWERQRQTFNRRTARLHSLMRNPRGPGAERWWPLALYTGWRPSLKSWFCYVVNRESHGQPHAVNPSSGCYGLLQEIGGWWASKGRRWIADPENQLRLGWYIYRVQGPAAWAL